MAERKKASKTPQVTRKIHPAITTEGRENQLIALATDLAAQQLMDGTASSQVITHFLKLGTTIARLEKEKLQKENELLKAKTDAIESQRRTEELYKKAITAMNKYRGIDEEETFDGEYDDY